MDFINEGSTALIEINFTNESGEAAIPTTAKYSIIDRDSETVLLECTEITVDSNTYDLEIAEEYNMIQNNNLPYEIRVITVKAEYNDGEDEKTVEYQYMVKNLMGITIEGD